MCQAQNFVYALFTRFDSDTTTRVLQVLLEKILFFYLCYSPEILNLPLQMHLLGSALQVLDNKDRDGS